MLEAAWSNDGNAIEVGAPGRDPVSLSAGADEKGAVIDHATRPSVPQ